MWFFSKKEVTIPLDFQNQNSVPIENEKLLCIGALWTEYLHNMETKISNSYQYLKLYYPKGSEKNVKKYWLPMWDIVDTKTAYFGIKNLIESDNIHTVNTKAHTAVVKAIEKEGKKSVISLDKLLQSADRVKNYGAFDIERAGYLTRVCYSLGYLDEAQAWELQTALWNKTNELFSSWEDYIVSVLNGSYIFDGFVSERILNGYSRIMMDSNNLLKRYTLQNLY